MGRKAREKEAEERAKEAGPAKPTRGCKRLLASWTFRKDPFSEHRGADGLSVAVFGAGTVTSRRASDTGTRCQRPQ